MKKLTSALLLVVFVFQLVGINAFASESQYNCGDYTYVLQNDGTAEITGYRGKSAVLSIPATLAGHRVTSIGMGAFADCHSLQSVTLPEGLESIGTSAFADCTSLQSVTLPDSLVNMNWNPFAACTNLTEIHVSADHPVYEAVDGVLFDKIDKKLICDPYAFRASSYTVPEGTRIIGANAFTWCYSLQSVTLPEGLENIGEYAFTWCYSLQSVTLPEGLENIGEFAFAACDSLQRVTLQEGLESIGDYAFSYCTSLQSVAIPASVTSIGPSAFAYYDESDVFHAITLEVAENSYAHTYAIENDIPYVLNDNEIDAAFSKMQSEANAFVYESASALDEVIAICKKYSDGSTATGVRNQIDWMNQLYSAISQDFVGQLGLGETLLIALLNHTEINTVLMTSSYSTGDINREVAKIILTGAEGYADVGSIAKATGLKEADVRDILESIVAGGITEKTIANGKDSNSATNRGTYVKNQALKQDKVWQYLIAEVARMTENPDSMAILCQDLGAGYVSNMMSGQEPDKYKVSLYKKYLAKTLDAVLDSDTPSIVSYDITKADTYKVAKKTRSVLSKIFSYEVGAEKNALSEELKAFWDEHLKNGVLSESEAREYLILSGEYQKGEHGIGEAAKQLVKGYKHLKRFKTVLDKTGKVFDAVDKLKKADEFLEYWATDYAEQEIMLDYLVESLSQSGADLDMMTAARELQQEYNDKLAVTFDKVYVAMIGKGVGTLKSAFPPLQIAEAVISLSATVTGADKKVGALETGLAMQGICSQALDDYEKAVVAVNEGDTSEEAASRVLSTFKIAKQSMILYCNAMIELAETDAQKEAYSNDLQKLEQAEFGYSAVSLPFGGGGGGSRGSRNDNADLTQFAENQNSITSSDEKAIEATVTSNIAVLEDGYYKVEIPIEYIVQTTDGSYKALVCVIESTPVCFSSEEVQSWKVGDVWTYRSKVITDLFWDNYDWLIMNNEYAFKPLGDGTYVLCSYNSPSLAEWWTDHYQYTASVTIPENTVTRAAGPGYPVTAQCVLELFDDSYEIHGFTPVYDALRANEISFWSARINVENGICTTLSIPDAYGSFSLSTNEYARMAEGLDTATAFADDLQYNYQVTITVQDYGTIVAELYPDIAPITVENFVSLAEQGFYDGLTFHRIISGFIIQGGDPNGDGTGGSENKIKGEFSANGIENSLSHTRGVLSMARANAYDSASSQFFIMHQDEQYLDGQYAAFGRVISGMETVDAICKKNPVTDNTGIVLKKNQPVITSITVEKTKLSTTSERATDSIAFETAFQHTANKIDKELCLQSANASKKAYSKQGIFDFLVSLGFDRNSIVQEDYESFATHSVAITMANRVVMDENGTPKTLYALIIRGTEGTLEWISNFDIGTSGVAKGFDKAASRVMGHFAKYVKNHAPLDGSFTDGNYLVWTCGHSRGAAVVNLIAGKYLPMYLASDNVYAYTFATPNVDKDATICKNIFNFVIQGDLVPRVPFSEWGFERYGLTLNYTNDEINGITLNTNWNTTMFSNLLTDKVKTQDEYVRKTQDVLQALEGENPSGDELHVFKVVLSAILSGGTMVDVIAEVGKSSAIVDIAWMLDYLGADLNADELFFTAEDISKFIPLILPSHSMDTYLEWMKQ